MQVGSRICVIVGPMMGSEAGVWVGIWSGAFEVHMVFWDCLFYLTSNRMWLGISQAINPKRALEARTKR